MKRKTLIAVAATIIAAVLVTAVVMYYVLRIRGHGVIKVVGIEAYADEACTKVCSEVDWGLIAPSEVKEVTIYLRNTGNAPVNLTMITENWSPMRASEFMTLSWDYDGTLVGVGGVHAVTLALSVDANISDISEFSFDIVITAAG